MPTLEELSAAIRTRLLEAEELLRKGPRACASVRLSEDLVLRWACDRKGSWWLGVGNAFSNPVLGDAVPDEVRVAVALALPDLFKQVASNALKLHEDSQRALAVLGEFIDARIGLGV